MGLFTLITATKVADELLSNKQLRSDLFNISVKGLSEIAKLIDTDDDGDFDEEDVNNLLEYSFIIASILGQAAHADGVVQELEEEAAWEVLHEACFEDEGIFTEDVLSVITITKKEIKNALIEKFQEPYGIKKIAKYGIENEVEEILYELACVIVGADEKILADEREFLNEFGSRMELSKFDVKRIEKSCFKDIL